MESNFSIGPYQVVDRLGEGGMGVVYRAVDPRLGRTVALKVLAPHLSKDADAAERFLREAQAAASAEHPNICTIYEVGEDADGRRFLAMPLYQGRSLRDLIDEGPVAVDRVVDIATQVARGLAAAHARGISHRDIKPGNLFVTDDGTVKILDFGLARTVDQETITAPGTTVGTAAYMSPEQVQGERLDGRTDIWSLGVVLHEMVAGSRPFRGDYPQAMVYAILNEDPPPLTSLRSGVPIGFDAVVAKCLQKDRDHRYQHADEIPADLMAMTGRSGASVRSGASSTAAPVGDPPGVPRRDGVRRAFAIAVPVLLLASLLVWRPWRGPAADASAPAEAMRLVMLLEPGTRLQNDRPSVAISRDGRLVAYASAHNDTTRLYVRPVNAFGATAIGGTEGAHLPFFSPDGSSIAYFTDQGLWRVGVEGGGPDFVTELSLGNMPILSGTWTEDDVIVYTLRDGTLGRVRTDGTILSPIGRRVAQDSRYLRFPQGLPGGEYVLAHRTRLDGVISDVVAVSVRDDSVVTVVESGAHPRFLPSGHLVYAVDSDLFVAPFDPDRLETTGPAVRVQEGVSTGMFGTSYYDVSDTGTLVYAASAVASIQRTLVWVDSAGDLSPLPIADRSAYTPRISPDGRFIAYQRRLPDDLHVYVFDTERGSVSKLTDADADVQEFWFAWSPDSRHLTFNSSLHSGTTMDTYLKPVATAGNGDRIVDAGVHTVPAEFTPDGRWLIYLRAAPPDEGTGLDIWAKNLESGEEAPVLDSKANEFHPSLSPDGRWLAYASDRTGRWQTFVQPWPEGGSVQQVSDEETGGGEPAWSPDGRTLYFRSRNGRRLYATPVSTAALDSGERSLRLGQTRLEMEGPYYTCSEYGRSYDVAADGRFLFVRDAIPGDEMGQLNVVVGWDREMARLLDQRG